MLIRFHMTRDPLTLPSATSCSKALALMKARNIRRIPVEHEGRITGIVTERDLLRVLPGSVIAGVVDPPIAQVQSRRLVSVHPSDPVEHAARVMLEQRVGGLPVMEDGRLVGIITESDLFRLLVGLHHGAGEHWLLLRARTEAQDELLRLCMAAGASIQSLIREPYQDGLDHVSLRVKCAHFDEFMSRLASVGYILIDSRRAA